MSHPIFMNWTNKTSTAWNFSGATAREGTLPSANPSTLGSNGSSSVSADQTGNFRAGPVGSYSWINPSDANQSIATSYVHPAGTGQSSVTVSCSAGFQVSSDGVHFYQQHTFTDASLQHHDATIGLIIATSASAG